MVNETSAMPRGLRPSVPLKMTSAISPPRKALADCSPRTQRMASETLDLPHPFGPTIAVTPGWKLSEVLSANDLNPRTVRFFRYMASKTGAIQLRRRGEVKRKTTTYSGKLFTTALLLAAGALMSVLAQIRASLPRKTFLSTKNVNNV